MSEGLLDAFYNVCACHNYVYPWEPEKLKMPIFPDNRKSHIIYIKQYLNMAAIEEYRTCICFFYQEMSQFRRRRNSSGILMATHFFLSNPGLRISRWFFGKKPTRDQETFKLMSFAKGNGCLLDPMRTWILLSQAWDDAKTAEKRSKRIDYIIDKTWIKKGRVGFISILIMANSCYSMANRRTKKIGWNF